MSEFQPSFEVTHVDSMQWNRTYFTGKVVGDSSPTPGLAPLSPQVLARVQEAVRQETAHFKG